MISAPPLDSVHTFIVIVMLALGIASMRFAPFLFFGGGRGLPEKILYLGRVLPQASMTLLLVYCLKDVRFLESPHGAPELLGAAFAAGLHIWRGNALLSIAGGTGFYMFLVQRIFI